MDISQQVDALEQRTEKLNLALNRQEVFVTRQSALAAPNTSTAALRTAIARVTDDPRYRAAARRMAARLAAERDDNHVVDELEQVAAGRSAPGNFARL